MPAPRKYPDELRERAQRLVAEAMTEDPSLSPSSALRQRNAASESASSSGETGASRVGMLVSVARSTPSSRRVSTVTGPAAVVRVSSPGPSRSASATAAATVACPQKRTSSRGLK